MIWDAVVKLIWRHCTVCEMSRYILLGLCYEQTGLHIFESTMESANKDIEKRDGLVMGVCHLPDVKISPNFIPQTLDVSRYNRILHSAQQLRRYDLGRLRTHEKHPCLALTGELWCLSWAIWRKLTKIYRSALYSFFAHRWFLIRFR